MRRSFLCLLILLLGYSASFAAPKPAQKMRTFLDVPGLPRDSLRSGVSKKFYKSLTISPLEAYIMARAPVYGTAASNAKIIRSEAGGAYDALALEMANSMRLRGMNQVESNIRHSHLDVHLLIYKIADGIMAVGFYHVDDAKYADYRQYGRATIGFLQNGKWTFMDNTLPRR